MDQLAVHFSLDGNLLHKESDEARRQLARQGLAEGTYAYSRTYMYHMFTVSLYNVRLLCVLVEL